MSISEREAVLRERAAFICGLRAVCWSDPATGGGAMHEARLRYPLPKITRPRVVTDADGDDWRINGSTLEFRPFCGDQWREPPSGAFGGRMGEETLRVIGELLEQRTECVEDDGAEL